MVELLRFTGKCKLVVDGREVDSGNAFLGTVHHRAVFIGRAADHPFSRELLEQAGGPGDLGVGADVLVIDMQVGDRNFGGFRPGWDGAP